MMNTSTLVYIWVGVTVVLMVCAWCVRNNESAFKFVSLLITTTTAVAGVFAVVFPAKTASAIYPEIDSYISENQTLHTENSRLSSALEELSQKYSDLEGDYNTLKESQDTANIADIADANLVVNGLDSADMKKCIALVNGKVYYDANVISQITGISPEYDANQNAIYWGNQNETERVSFADISDQLYNGKVYGKYRATENKSFSVAGKEHFDGFTIGCDHSLFGEGDGYVLFNLDGEFSKMEFDVGKTDNYEIQDVTLKVFLGEDMVKQIDLSGQKSSEHVEVDLNYANDVKIMITGGSRVIYGFYNIIFTK